MNVKKFVMNYISVLSLTFLSLLGSFLANIFINFYYGKKAFGEFSTIYNIVLFFSVFVAFGVGQYLLREVSVNRVGFDRAIPFLRNILIFTYIFSFLMYIIFIIISNYDYDLKILIFLSLPIIYLLGAINLLSNIELIKKNFIKATFISTSFHIVMIATLLIVLIGDLRFQYFIILLAFLSLSISLYMFNKVKVYFRGLLESSEKIGSNPKDYNYRTILKQVSPFGIMGLMYFIYYQSDIILLSLFENTISVAEYNAAFSILAALLVLPKVLYQKLLAPYIYENFGNGNYSSRFVSYQSIFIVFSIILYLIVAFFANDITLLLFGAEYHDAHMILIILGISFIFRFIYGFSSVVLNLQEHLITKMYIMAVTALLNIVLNLIFIPIYGIYGAAITTVFSEGVLCLLMTLKFKQLKG